MTEPTIREQVKTGLTKLRAFLRDESVLLWIEPHPRTMLEGDDAFVSEDFALEFTTVSLLPHHQLFMRVEDLVYSGHPKWRDIVKALYLKTGLASFLVRLDLDKAPHAEVLRIFGFILFFLECAREAAPAGPDGSTPLELHTDPTSTEGEDTGDDDSEGSIEDFLLDLVERASFARMNRFLLAHLLLGTSGRASTGTSGQVEGAAKE